MGKRTSSIVAAVAIVAAIGGTVQAATLGIAGPLNEVIARAHDGHEGYRLAAEKVQDPALKQMFTQYSQERAEYARTLEAEVAEQGAKPADDASAKGAAHRGWINIKAAVTKGDKAILDEVIRGEEAALKSYDDALAKPELPADVRDTLTKQRKEVADSLEKVREQRAVLNI